MPPLSPRLEVWILEGKEPGGFHGSSLTPGQSGHIRSACLGLQVSAKSEWTAGWRRQDKSGSQWRADLFTQFIPLLPRLQEERRGVTNHPQAALTPREGGAPVDMRVPGPTFIRQIACHHPSPGSSFEELCQEKVPEVPRLKGWPGWAVDQQPWPVLPGICQILHW